MAGTAYPFSYLPRRGLVERNLGRELTSAAWTRLSAKTLSDSCLCLSLHGLRAPPLNQMCFAWPLT